MDSFQIYDFFIFWSHFGTQMRQMKKVKIWKIKGNVKMTDEGKWKILATTDPHEVKITITGEFKVENTEFSGE